MPRASKVSLEDRLLLALEFLSEGSHAAVPQRLSDKTFRTESFGLATEKLQTKSRPWIQGHGRMVSKQYIFKISADSHSSRPGRRRKGLSARSGQVLSHYASPLRSGQPARPDQASDGTSEWEY